MKIRAIRYQNFRQFGEKGEVSFSTDGKTTIVYGTNGDGKTTLHQLFQWVLYKKVTFNRTTSDTKLYNLKKGAYLSPECSLLVWGEVEFEHEGIQYVARREYTYYKQKNGNITHKSEDDQFYVQKRTDNNWGFMESPEAFIEEVVPVGLSPYFFFDGETMIADLKIRGTDSAKTLRKALYSIFELEAYEKAVDDVGSTNRSQTVLGQLENLKIKAAEISATEEIHKRYLKEIKILKSKLEECENENFEYSSKIEELSERLKIISELIGTNKSKAQLENARKSLLTSKKREQEQISKEMLRFGSEIEGNYAYLLISEVVKSADSRLYMQVQDEEEKIIPGLTKELLINLLRDAGEKNCLCGRCIGDDERAKLEEWKGLFPPASYKATYDKFRAKAIKFSGKYNADKLYEYLRSILQCKKNISDIEKQIDEIDTELKNCGDIDELIAERKDKEKEKSRLEGLVKSNESNIGNFQHQLRIRERKTGSFDKANDEVNKYQRRIDFVKEVVQKLKDVMNEEVKDYSSMLEREIQTLIERMLTSKRKVVLSEDFQLQVMDSYLDEAKSEGQFAVVSFAFIGGIFKVLKSHDKLLNKEYPLVLDGPFSKLDPTQKGNVVRVIPEYAPQVIIFSKDPLDEFIDEESIGKIWTIVSNPEKNDAEIKEGYLWK